MEQLSILFYQFLTFSLLSEATVQFGYNLYLSKGILYLVINRCCAQLESNRRDDEEASFKVNVVVFFQSMKQLSLWSYIKVKMQQVSLIAYLLIVPYPISTNLGRTSLEFVLHYSVVSSLAYPSLKGSQIEGL